MSPGDRRRMPRGHRSRVAGRGGERGFTIVEILIGLSVLAMLAYLVERTIFTSQDALRYLDAARKAQDRSDRTAYLVHEMVSSSRRVITRGDVGEGYLAALDLSRRPPAPDVRLPALEETRPLGPDLPGEPRTGNLLLFVRETDPVACAYSADGTQVRYIDVYRFVCAYPSEVDRSIITDDGERARDLVLWISHAYASAEQILAIEDADRRARVVASLVTTYDIGIAWDAAAPAPEAFHALHADGRIDDASIADHLVAEARSVSPGGQLTDTGHQLARSDADDPIRRAVFSAGGGDPAAWVPDGFEVKLVGPSGRRKIWFRVVVETQSGRGREAVAATTLIATARDL